jgi:predicted small lipoprotein YifL
MITSRNINILRKTLPCFFLLLLLFLLAGCGSSDNLQFPTEYQAVFMDNGQVFFGRLQKTNSDFFLLRDVFYIKHEVDKDQKESRNILLKRGMEWHGPEFMRINSRHIVLIEPVAPDSRVFQLIMQAHRPAPPPAPPAATPTPPAPQASPAPPAQPEKGKTPPARK